MLYINLKKLTKCSLSSRAYVKKAIANKKLITYCAELYYLR